MIRNQRNHHEQQQSQPQSPVEIPRARVQTSDYFEDNQLKHGQREGERRRENQLHEHMPDLVVPKQLLHKEDPSSDKENNLTHRKENCRLISNKKNQSKILQTYL